MKLVTFCSAGGGRAARPRAGALVDGGRRVVDLQACHRGRYGKASPMLASVLAMVEAGDKAEPGDTVELEVEGIGVLRNRVVK